MHVGDDEILGVIPYVQYVEIEMYSIVEVKRYLSHCYTFSRVIFNIPHKIDYDMSAIWYNRCK